MSLEKIIDRISKLTLREVESTDLQSPAARSYEDLVNELLSDVGEEVPEIVLRMIKSTISVLLHTRLEKILRKLSYGEQIQKKMLYLEERRIVQIFEKIDEISRQATVTRRRAETRPLGGTEQELVMIAMKDTFPAIQTSRMERLGPFLKFDIVTLPPEDAAELVRKGIGDVLRL
ncbi:MAG: hypothetical protein GXO23_07310 [Crenarchaeota archaeon]|nr:hypothetical protein [Thermoproteota archaeon]